MPSLRTLDEHPLLVSDLKTMTGWFTEFDVEFLNLAKKLLCRFSFLAGLALSFAELDKGPFTMITPQRRCVWSVVLDHRLPKAA